MGLEELSDVQKKQSQSSSRAGGSSGNYHRKSRTSGNPSNSSFPIYTLECPEVLILENEDGELEVLRYPETPEIELEKTWWTEPWQTVAPSENWVRWLWKEEYKRIKHRVEDKLKLDLDQLLEEDAEKALKAIKRAANEYAAAKRELTERCPVCREKIHVITGSYEVIDNRRVCKSHTVEDLAEADLI